MDKLALKITADGSHTLYLESLNETYHSKHGAIQEAMHVFLNAGFHYFDKQKLNVLEIGFGTGLNAFLTLLAAEKNNVKVNYTSLEAFPLKEEVIRTLNYTKELNSSKQEIEWFKFIHQTEWENYQKITPMFNINKVKVELANYKTIEKFNIIYFDAFGPRVQPEMWSKEIFEKIYNSLNDGGILVTYCAKGSVKRTLKEVGFEIEGLPGPPGKREMTRAKKVGN